MVNSCEHSICQANSEGRSEYIDVGNIDSHVVDMWDIEDGHMYVSRVVHQVLIHRRREYVKMEGKITLMKVAIIGRHSRIHSMQRENKKIR